MPVHHQYLFLTQYPRHVLRKLRAMDGKASAQKIDGSDYGSELESDEEVSLTELLQQVPVKQHHTTASVTRH